MLNPKKPRKITGDQESNDPNARRKLAAPTCAECGLPITQTHGTPDFDEKGWFTPTTYTCPDGHEQKVRSTHEPLGTVSARDRAVERRVNRGM